MADANEKLALSSELGALSAKMMTEQAIDELKASPKLEYDSLMQEIQEGYNSAASTAAAERDNAVAAANNALNAARTAYQNRMSELGRKKSDGEAQAQTYYQECVDNVNTKIDEQNQLRARYQAVQARIAEIERQEEEERKAAEAARKAAEEEAARKAREEEAARLAAARAAGATVSTRKPHIRF